MSSVTKSNISDDTGNQRMKKYIAIVNSNEWASEEQQKQKNIESNTKSIDNTPNDTAKTIY